VVADALTTISPSVGAKSPGPFRCHLVVVDNF
jgi:hypothetical protein